MRRQQQVNRVKVEVNQFLGHSPLDCSVLQGSEADFRGPYRLALSAFFSHSEYAFHVACTATAVTVAGWCFDVRLLRVLSVRACK